MELGKRTELMELFTLVNILKTRNMEQENFIEKMDHFMKVNFKIMILKDKELTHELMEENMKDNDLKIKCMEREF